MLAGSYLLWSGIEHIWQKLYRLGFYRGGPVFMSALAGVDIALWDLKGEYRIQIDCRVAESHEARKLGVPIYELLGGKLRTQLKVYAWIGGDRPADVEVQAYVPSVEDLSHPMLALKTSDRILSLRVPCRNQTAVCSFTQYDLGDYVRNGRRNHCFPI
jgi:Mandelate racemase / muconate lactonizing enzyme, N-terminal domain